MEDLEADGNLQGADSVGVRATLLDLQRGATHAAAVGQIIERQLSVLARTARTRDAPPGFSCPQLVARHCGAAVADAFALAASGRQFPARRGGAMRFRRLSASW